MPEDIITEAGYALPLEEFFARSVTDIKVVGEKSIHNVIRLVGGTYQDILYHLPTGAVRRDKVDAVDLDIHIGEIISCIVTVVRHKPSTTPRSPYRVVVMAQGKDAPLEIHLVYFNASPDYLRNILPVGSQRVVSGKLEQFDMLLQMSHPDYVVAKDRLQDLPMVQPLYPLTAGVTQRIMGKIISSISSDIPATPEWIREDMLKKYGWQSLDKSLKQIHHPDNPEDSSPKSIYRMRIAFDRILAHQLMLGRIRQKRRDAPLRVMQGTGLLKEALYKVLPFSLTSDQIQCLQDIEDDLSGGQAMARLVQGDVGSGKTIVALLSSAKVIESKAQVAMMTPTEILAKQHYASLKPLCDAVGIRLALLTGKDKASDAHKTLMGLSTGTIDFVIGTHALIQERVQFHNLGLGIIDEQHRFGVEQRNALAQKGFPYAHILVMTATPIPRSLAMTRYGDTDISFIRQKPAGRKPITTKVMPAGRLEEIARGLNRVIQAGGRAYWVCPLVEESEKIDLMAAQERFYYLDALYPNQVGLVHGKMKTAQKDDVVCRFMAGDITILVATTVIEVGVNVPEATVMVIEEAERFGLSQLHQLRGRVGRGTYEASCLLLYKSVLSRTAYERLSIIRDTEDGFILAEKDLELRGAGDLLGTKQTGLLTLKGFDYEAHSDLIPLAREDVRFILQTDPSLKSERGLALRSLLKLFVNENMFIKA